MTARMAGLGRDTRKSHPFGLYLTTAHHPITKRHGDVYSRTQIRYEEIKQSLEVIRHWLSLPLPVQTEINQFSKTAPGKLGVSLVEGWRGEICHCAVTDENGELLVYKIKDPSLQNWLALSLSVRENEISDFPVNNKSFNLSYCGFDL
jgi:Ni,Fe-hydrogenase III large subunit